MKLVIVDRDGTLCVEREGYLQTPDDWAPLPGALDAIARLNHAGYQVVIAANLPGLGRGLFDMAALNAIHAKMNKQVAAAGGRIEAVFFCPHTPDEGCNCRKPLPGLFQQIGERYKLDLTQVHAVGDSERDVQAAVAAGCVPPGADRQGAASADRPAAAALSRRHARARRPGGVCHHLHCRDAGARCGARRNRGQGPRRQGAAARRRPLTML